MNEAEIRERKSRATRMARETHLRLGGRKCRSCRADVIFAVNTKTGNWMIVDALPDWTRGNVYLTALDTVRPAATVWDVQSAASNRNAGVPFHLDHHATCPYADEHRRDK